MILLGFGQMIAGALLVLAGVLLFLHGPTMTEQVVGGVAAFWGVPTLFRSIARIEPSSGA